MYRISTATQIFGAVLVSSSLWANPTFAIDFNPLSYIKGAVEAAVEDRSSSDIAKDLEIKAKITAEVIDKMGTDVISINADVYEQDVMLTGTVETPQQRLQASSVTRGIQDVKKVFNEVKVVKKIDEKKGVVENFVDDAVIESKINALLIDASGVNVTNFRWRSIGGDVFVFGRALEADELRKALKVIKEIKNVSSVTSRVKIRSKK
jgi:hyperosmotically inducible periplasmic protein